MEQKDTITVFQMTLILMMVIGLQNHVIVVKPLIQTAGRDGWMSIVLITFVTLGWGFLILFIQKGMNQEHIYSWLKKQTGKLCAFSICACIYVYCIILAIVTLRETMVWVKMVFLQNTHVFILVIMMLILCVLATLTCLRTIAIATFFLLFFVVIFGIFVAVTNLQVKDYSLLLPMLEHGLGPVMKGMIYPGQGVGELLLLIFLQHKYENKVRYHHIFWNILFLTLLTVGPVIGGIIEFGPIEAGFQRFTAFEEWGLVSLGRYIEHLDFLSIYQWLSGAFIRITVLFFVALEIFPTKSKKLKIGSLFLICCIVFSVVVYPISDLIYYQLLKYYILPTALVFSLILSFVLGCIVFIVNARKKRSLTL